MLSPPRRMCSPTLMRSTSRLPSFSVTAIRLKSAVPPPTSQTRTISPRRTWVRQSAAGLRRPGIKGRLRLFEQDDFAEAGRFGGRGGQISRNFVEGGRDGQHHLTVREVPGAGPGWIQRSRKPSLRCSR